MLQVTANLSSLSSLLPYLEVTSDQVYLVERLRQLAATGAMSRYCIVLYSTVM